MSGSLGVANAAASVPSTMQLRGIVPSSHDDNNVAVEIGTLSVVGDQYRLFMGILLAYLIGHP